MGFLMSTISQSLLLVLLVFCCFTKDHVHANKVFNLKDYGIVKGGPIDEALLKAWGDACGFKGGAQLEIPDGIYLVNKAVEMKGPCNGPIRFRLEGTLRASLGLTGQEFITFLYIDGLAIDGGGSIDGQGQPKKGSPYRFPLRFDFVTNSKVENIHLINSPSTHFNLFGCNNTEIHQITISTPGDWPNTDGIKLGRCQGITISDSHIASGDDCVAILTGTKNLTVTGITCGPGHGVSIGSLGGEPNDRVEDVFVHDCTFIGTTNGVRIKTKATNNPGLVTNIVFQDIVLENGVDNPIIIDQNYCPPKNCAKGNSRVQISNVKYINVRGTSTANIAVNLECSGSNPCQKIELKDIEIKYQGPGGASGRTSSKCSYASGEASGVQVPKACF